MRTKRSSDHFKGNGEKAPSVPPGFMSLTSLTLKRTVNNGEIKPGVVNSPISNSDIEKFKSSLWKRPWILHDQFDCARLVYDPEPDKVDMKCPLKARLPKGMVRGCESCHDCVKVTARWHPDESHLFSLDEAPVFSPTEEEFKDTIKYIAKIRSKAENYGICRIVPPRSWRPPCIFKDKQIWETSKFSTRVQNIDGLQNACLKRKTFHEKMENKRQKMVDPEEAEFGPDFTFLRFNNYADSFKRQYFAKNDKDRGPDVSSIAAQVQQEPVIADVEGEYWRIVENPSEEIEVLCGTNLESQTFGSESPIITCPVHKAAYSRYVESGWNLNNTPKLPGSLLPFGCYDNSSILIPQLSIGMCFASHCWRNEDHHLYSLSYMHLGEPKVRYGIPGRYCFKFVEVVKKLFPQLSNDPSSLHKFVPQISPSTLISEGIPVYHCVQNPLEFVLTFPGAYHSEFDCGFNISESVRLAPFDWLPHGQNIVELYIDSCRETSFSHDRLLFGAAIRAVEAQWETFVLRKDSSDINRLWRSVSGKNGILTKALKSRVKHEDIRRVHLCGPSVSIESNEFDDDAKRVCTVCSYDLYLSAVGCSCTPNTYSCLRHAEQLCSCPWGDKSFLLRYEITELTLLVEALEDDLKAICSWAKRKSQPVTDSEVVKLHKSPPEAMREQKNSDPVVSRISSAASNEVRENNVASRPPDVVLLSDDDED